MNNIFTFGLMGAGKSAELIRKYESDPRKKIALSASLDKDTGSDGMITSRNGTSIPSINISNSDDEEAYDFISFLIIARELEVVYFDEVQFLPKSLVEELLYLSSEMDIEFYFYGLHSTFSGAYFEPSEALLNSPYINHIKFIPSPCEVPECREMASMNARIIDGSVSRHGELFLEAKSSYEARCIFHYFT